MNNKTRKNWIAIVDFIIVMLDLSMHGFGTALVLVRAQTYDS